MEKSEKIFNKVLNSLYRMAEEKERMEYMLYYINRLLKTEETLFLNKQQIPKRGLARYAWQHRESFFVNELSEDDRYDETYDNYGNDIQALLFYPVLYKEEYIGLLVCTGKEAYTKTEEQMTPLKSGDKTIGVTVKQATVKVPAHHFASEDIELLDTVLPSLMKAMHLEKDEASEKSKEDNNNSLLKNTVNKMKQFFGNKH